MADLCPKKDVCGSCSLSDQPYDFQLNSKLALINAEFEKNGFEIKVSNIIPSPKTSHYRNRMDFVISYKGEMGLRQKGKWWKVIDAHTCFISEEKIEQIFKIATVWLKKSTLTYFDRKSFVGFLRYLVIRCTKKGEVLLNIVTSPPLANTSALESSTEKRILQEFTKYINTMVSDTSVVWSINKTNSDVSFGDEIQILSGNGYITEEINNYSYKITPNSFSQTNSYSAENLQNTVLDFFSDSFIYPEQQRSTLSHQKLTDKKILDLYCGSGFFSIPLAKNAKEVVGIELIEDAINDARTNAMANNVQIQFEARKAEDLSWKDFGADYVLVDPPRVGLHPTVLSTLLNMYPEKIVYVSCNYKSFIKEFAEFSKKYKISKITAVDMFPHTPHVELVIGMDRI